MDTLFYGNTVTQWLITFGLMALSVIVGRIVYWFIGRLIKRLTQRTQTKLDDILVDMVEEPGVALLVVIGLRFSLTQLQLATEVVTQINTIYSFALALLVGWLIVRLYSALHQEYLIPLAGKTQTDLDDQLLPIVKTSVRFIVWALAVIIGLNNAGYDVGTILAGLGVGGLAFALAAQDTVANIFGGVTIFTQRLFAVGDRIAIVGIEGWVTEVGLRSSAIVDFYGQKTILPNKLFTDNPVKNISVQPSYLTQVPLRLRYDTTAEQVQQALDLLKAVVNANAYTEPDMWLHFDGFGPSALNIEVWYYIKKWQPEDQATLGGEFHKIFLVKTQINLEIMRQFEAHGIHLALPLETRLGLENHPTTATKIQTAPSRLFQ